MVPRPHLLLPLAALSLLLAAASASQQDGAVAEIDQAAALRSALHLNVEVSGDAHHLANAASLKNDGRISSRPLRIFHFDPPREFGVGISHEAQRHVDEFLGALEHTSHMGREWQRVFSEKMKLRSFERPNAGFISPSKALEHMLGASPAVPSHRMKLQAATVSSGGISELRVALVSNFSDDTLAVEAMLREGQPESDAVPHPVPAPWYGGVWVAVVGSGFGSASDAGQNVHVFVGKRPCLDSVWISPRLLLCCVPPAAGGTADLAVVVGDTSYALPNAIAYEAPHVTAVAPKNSPIFNMYGGFFVTLLGRHFGHVDTTVRRAPVMYCHAPTTADARNCSIKVGGTSCERNMWFSDSSILCKLLPGEGSSKSIEVDAMYSPHLQQQPQAGIDYARKFLDTGSQPPPPQEL